MKKSWSRKLSMLTALSMIVTASGQVPGMSMPVYAETEAETPAAESTEAHTEAKTTEAATAHTEGRTTETAGQGTQATQSAEAAGSSQSTEAHTEAKTTEAAEPHTEGRTTETAGPETQATEQTAAAHTEGETTESAAAHTDGQATESAAAHTDGQATESAAAPAEIQTIESAAAAAESATEDSADAAYPELAQTTYAGNALVSVKAEEGAFPEGTKLVVTPVSAGYVMKESRDLFRDEVVDAEAVDISFYFGGEELEPEDGTVQVSISLADAVEGEEQHLVHIEDSGAASVIPAESLDSTSADFETDSFSIYAIVGTDDDNTDDEKETGRLTYLFYNGDQLVMRQIVKNGDTLVRPQDPEREGYIFLGWEEREDNSQTDDSASGNGTTDNSSDGEDNSGSDAGASDGADDGAGQDDTGSDAGTSDGADGGAGKDDTGSDAGSDDSNGNGAGSGAGQDTTGDGSGQDSDDYFNGFGVVKDIEDDDQIILDAQFAKVYYVAFHDEEGDVIRQGQYQEGATCQTSGVQLTLSDNEEGIDYLKGWSKEADPEKRAENMVGETFSVDENVDLYPVIVRRFLVRFLPYEGFEDDPYAWHYNMPDDQYVEDGKCAEEPDPGSDSVSPWEWSGERNGYTFAGWSTLPSILDRKNETGEPLDPDMDADPQDQPLFDFKKPLIAADYKDSASRTINLYPVWENGETTTYTVIAMLENVDSDKAVNEQRHKDGTVRYDQNWMSRRVYTAKVGDTITAETPDVKTAMDQFIKDNPGYTYARDPEHDPYKQTVKVSRNGQAEFCVYLDAKVLTLKFYTSYDGKIHWYTNYASGENAGSLDWSSPEEYYNVTIPTATIPTATIHARSGEDISKEWPDPKKATISAKPGYKDLGLNPFCWVTKTTYVDRDFEEIQEAPKYFASDADENGEVSYYIQFCKDYDKYEWNYYIQKDDVDDWTKDPGNSFEKYETLTDYGSGLTQPEFPPFMNGCTQIDPRNLPDSLKKDSGNVRYLYYARNSYPLYLVSGGKVIGAYESEDNKDASIAEKYGSYKVNGPAIMYGKDISSLMPGSNSCTADLPERPDDVPENYRLAGWKDNEFGTFPTFFHSMSSGTLVLEAVWAPGPVTVTADPGNGEESKTYKLYNNETASNIQTPVREGYTFAGWVTEDGKPFYTYEKVTKDTKIIAQWYKAGQKIKVVYDPGEGTDAPTDDRLYTGGGSFIVGKAPKAPEGKHFSGWKLGEETFRYGDAVEITPGRAALATEAAPASENAAVSTGTAASGNTANATSGNAAETPKHVSAAASSRRAPKAAVPAAQVSVLTLTAVYTDEKPLEPARITYFANNGTDQAYSEQVENNSTYTIKNSEALNFLKAGWYFSGWNTKADGTGTVYKAGDTVGVDNTTDNQLFAQWSKVPVKETEETDEDETEEETEAEAENKTPAHHDTGSGTTEAKPAGTDTSVKTGDQTPVGNYLAYALAALAAAGILVAVRRKREDN